jgi:EAL domain-containing protein (putative c-di-GMP-specific phosphodiesterase class I)
LRAACAEARSWPGHLRLSVNLSAEQLQDPRMPERILAALTQTGFPARRLEVEVTEKALMRDGEAARVALASLHNLGVGLTLDNFGASYSILSHLSELRFSKLKIDRSYAHALSKGEPRAALMEAILQLGAQLRVLTTAAGVETADKLEWLSNQGCSYGQGYLFGRAMPGEAAAAYIGRDARGTETKLSVGF